MDAAPRLTARRKSMGRMMFAWAPSNKALNDFRKLYGRFLRAISCASATPADAQPSRAAANQQGAAFFVVRCSLPCDPPAGGHSCNGGIIPRFHRAVWERPMGRSSQCFRLTAVEAALNGEGRIYKAADMGRCQALRFWVRQRPLVVGLRWLGADLVVGPLKQNIAASAQRS